MSCGFVADFAVGSVAAAAVVEFDVASGQLG